jgi:hypothetical protein
MLQALLPSITSFVQSVSCTNVAPGVSAIVAAFCSLMTCSKSSSDDVPCLSPATTVNKMSSHLDQMIQQLNLEPIVQSLGSCIENCPYCSVYFLNCPVAVCANAWPLSNTRTDRKNIILIVTRMGNLLQINV